MNWTELVFSRIYLFGFVSDVVGFSSESAMVDSFLQTLDSVADAKKVLAGVVFNEVPSVQSRASSSSIEYKLRFPSTLRSAGSKLSFGPFNTNDRWMTQLMYPVVQKVGPRHGTSPQGGPPGWLFYCTVYNICRSIWYSVCSFCHLYLIWLGNNFFLALIMKLNNWFSQLPALHDLFQELFLQLFVENIWWCLCVG